MIQESKYKFVKKLESKEEYQKMADDLLAYVQKEGVLDINEFPLSLLINPEDFAKFSEHSDYFATAY